MWCTISWISFLCAVCFVCFLDYFPAILRVWYDIPLDKGEG